ncbi:MULTISPECIES: hypothetical protein [unclassified Mesorhizobium]|uniref:hypothetical protein n=1 Tax=unclassified Mesorhizobium TaxID=325217 RepID=UPI0011294C70|nr:MULTISPECIES: hypothetical protein [unclassified Mesorhizobium]MBZ9701624.1 hypothetical protein [Mesorhizobium sp. CO1-1-3]MBZ9949234.1 hypothetical protein [Mesorhizobium sp. BR1-1-11]TPI99569.1 hypothetical protein FJ428_21785 [Mesorhizobium sp. B2-8-1]
MKFKDFWGLNVGENAAIAVSFAARKEGATMGEISSHTGQNLYNVFKRFKEFGHHVAKVERMMNIMRHALAPPGGAVS